MANNREGSNRLPLELSYSMRAETDFFSAARLLRVELFFYLVIEA